MPFKSQAQRRKFYAMKSRGEISAATVKHWEDATPKGKLPEHVKQAAFLDELSIIMKEAEEVEAPHGGDIGPDVEKGSGAIPGGPLEEDAPAKEESAEEKEAGATFRGLDYIDKIPKGKRLATIGKDYMGLLAGRKSESALNKGMSNVLDSHRGVRQLKGMNRDVTHGYIRDVIGGKKPVSMEWGDKGSLDLENRMWAHRDAVSRARSQENLTRLLTGTAVAAPIAYGLNKMSSDNKNVSDYTPAAAGAFFGSAPILQGLKSKALSLSSNAPEKGKKLKSVRDVSKALQPGDIVLTSSPGKSGYFKSMISGLGADPHGYHVTTVTSVPKNRKRGAFGYVHASPQEGGAYGYSAHPDKGDDVIIKRFKDPAHREKFLENLETRQIAEEGLEERFGGAARGSMYDTPRGVRSAGRSFLPESVARALGGKEAPSPGASVCSSLPGMASPVCLAKGVEGANILPHHIRRSAALETAGIYHAKRTGPQLLYEKALSVLPWAIRGAAGLGLGYGAYRGAKALMGQKDKD